MTEPCAACEKNRKGVYATPFGADHHHARIAELEAKLRSASAANARLSKERDEARAALTFIREQFPSVWDHAEFAPFRPILGEKP